MDLVLIRHAIAEDAAPFIRAGGRDEDRPLTDAGVRKLRSVVRGLLPWMPVVDVLVSSPLRRARETADVLVELGGLPAPVLWADVTPESDPAACLPRLDALGTGAVALVGHEPHLGRLASLLIGGSAVSGVRFRKAGAALLSLDGARAGGGRLEWLLTSRQLRELAD